ncbi:MAG: hypothetical protein C4523_16715 [Myxococcales bacterium]|nr:MAG: hypothetical protein C4523_16715 [Myxococcales bacterium]
MGAAKCLVLLMDGLDEATATSVRAAALDFLVQVVRAAPGVVVVTSRPMGYVHPAFGVEVRVATIKALTVDGLVRLSQALLGISKSQAFLRALSDQPAAELLARNPLVATYLTALFCESSTLPKRRTGVFGRIIRRLLSDWAEQDAKISKSPSCMLRDLRCLAWCLLQRGAEIFGDSVSMPPLEGESIDLAAFASSGLVDPAGIDGNGMPMYQFVHRSLRDFLAAEEAVNRRRVAFEELSQHFFAPNWREVTVLVAEVLVTSEIYKRDVPDFVDALMPSSELDDNVAHDRLILIGAVLTALDEPTSLRRHREAVDKAILELGPLWFCIAGMVGLSLKELTLQAQSEVEFTASAARNALRALSPAVSRHTAKVLLDSVGTKQRDLVGCLVEIGPYSDSSIRRHLLSVFENASPDSVWAAAPFLDRWVVSYPDEVRNALLVGLQSSHPAIRVASALAFGAWGPEAGEQAVHSLLHCVDDQDLRVVRNSMKALGLAGVGRNAIVRPVIVKRISLLLNAARLSTSKNYDALRAAQVGIIALGLLDPWDDLEAASIFLVAVDQGPDEVRQTALAVLRDIVPEKGSALLNLLQHSLAHGGEEVQSLAVTLLARVVNVLESEVVEQLVGMLGHRSNSVYNLTARELSVAVASGANSLAERIREIALSGPEAIQQGCVLIVLMCGKRVFPDLTEIGGVVARHPDKFIKFSGLTLLVENQSIEDHVAVAEIGDVLKSPNRSIIINCAAELSKWICNGKISPSLCRELLTAIASVPRDTWVVEYSLATLIGPAALIYPEWALTNASELMAAKNAKTRARALEALTNIPTKLPADVCELALSLVKDSDTGTRLALSELLIFRPELRCFAMETNLFESLLRDKSEDVAHRAGIAIGVGAALREATVQLLFTQLREGDDSAARRGALRGFAASGTAGVASEIPVGAQDLLRALNALPYHDSLDVLGGNSAVRLPDLTGLSLSTALENTKRKDGKYNFKFREWLNGYTIPSEDIDDSLLRVLIGGLHDHSIDASVRRLLQNIVLNVTQRGGLQWSRLDWELHPILEAFRNLAEVGGRRCS